MTVPVITRSYDNCRSGANLNETILTPAYLKANGIRLLFTIPLGPDARGSEGQPLYVPGLVMGDGISHNVVYHATMYNQVVADDADTGERLWLQQVGVPIKGTTAMDMYLINDYWGILSTPVIDYTNCIIYICAMTSLTADFADSGYVVMGLSLYDGQPMKEFVNLNTATYTAPGSDTPTAMKTVPRKQRCGLALAGGILYVCNGSFNEDADTNQGWIVAIDTSTSVLTIDSTFTTTYPPSSGGGVWMGSQAPSIDPETGDLFLSVGNGDFDGVNNWGESVLRIHRTPSSIAASGEQIVSTLAVIDWFTPFTDSGRVGNASTQTDESADDVPNQIAEPSGTSNMDSPGDEDLNSGGPLLITTGMSGLPWNMVVAAGKDGIGYFINADKMGSPALADFAPNLIQANVYDKLLIPPYGLPYYPGDVDIAPLVLNEIPTTAGGFTHHLHSTCVFYKSAKNGPAIYCWGENGNLRAFGLSAVNDALQVTYLGCSIEVASQDCVNSPPGGMPGGMITLSSNGGVDGVIWACVPYGDANKTISQGRLIAYDAETFTNGVMTKLWDSQDWGVAFKHDKFCIPTVVNGKVYCPTYQAETLVLG